MSFLETNNKLEQAKIILRELGLPTAQQNEISGYTLLALCQIREDDTWNSAERISLGVSKGIMAFIHEAYNKEYAPNTRETFRRQVLHQFVQAAVVEYNPDDPNLPVNSPKAHYAISPAALEVIKTFGTENWREKLESFHNEFGELSVEYRKEREQLKVPVKLPDGTELKLSPGRHNEVQAAIVEQFATRFAKGSILIYLGDTENKGLYLQSDYFKMLGVNLTNHSKLPDVVIHDPNRNRLYLIEAVTSHGPVSPKRVVELDELFAECSAELKYITAFPDFKEFKAHAENIAWETEVWISEIPDHMIHFNGEKFLDP